MKAPRNHFSSYVKAAVLLLALLVALVLARDCHGQTVSEQPWPIYRGNTGERSFLLDVADSAATVSAQTFYDRNGRLLPPAQQVTLTRTGRLVTLSVSKAQSLILPETGWLEVRVGVNVRLAYRLYITKGTVATPPVPLTLINQTTVVQVVGGNTANPLPTGFSRMGSLRRFYDLTNAQSGDILEHNVGSKLVRGEFFPEVQTDDDYQDSLWRVIYLDENRVTVRGPTGETFTGTMVLTIFQKPISNQ